MSLCGRKTAGSLTKLAVLALVLSNILPDAAGAADDAARAYPLRGVSFPEARSLDLPSGLATPVQFPSPGRSSEDGDVAAPGGGDIVTSVHRVEARTFRGTNGQRPQLVVGCRNGNAVLWIDWKVPAASVDPRVSVLIERDAAMVSVWRLSGDRQRTYAPVPAVLLARIETARNITVELMRRSGEGRVAAFDVSGLTSRLSPVAGNCD
ncbi:hypothetical protein MVG78_01870 [Roseomonas gilardii subsp. gilardii]|uniref:hypothetical protein n=1 Tax=Roseomonas gilardii TaxID=257708 RepID=UPI001FFB57AB|nr:hypothetical protein [Roseomonas gilardii]UPG72960.1 hypothetical protein MVG78_01870 [Roseomonas gilardii subsp. gilardii]